MRTIPLDRVLNLWVRGWPVRRIVAQIGDVDGSRFRAESITHAIRRARKAGDPRAKRRRTWWSNDNAWLEQGEGQ